ncbi:hypothetical protein D3C78_1592850 [compost metagenome]
MPVKLRRRPLARMHKLSLGAILMAKKQPLLMCRKLPKSWQPSWSSNAVKA